MRSTRLRHIIITEFLFLIGFGMMIPLLPLYGRELGASATVIGILLAANQTVDFFFAPFAGRISDRLGRRILLLPAMLLTSAAYLAIGFSTSLAAIFIVWSVAGFGSAHVLLSQAYVADVTSDKSRTTGMAYWGAAFAMAFVVGPPLGAFLFARNPQIAATVAAVMALLATVYAFFFLGEPERVRQPQTKRTRSFRRLPELKSSVITIVALNFALIFMWSQFTTVLPLYTQDVFAWSVGKFGMYLGSIGLVAAIVQGGLVGRLAKRIRLGTLVSTGFGLLGVGLAVLAAPLTTLTMIISIVGIAVGFGLLTPSLPALLSMNVAPERKGLALGIFQSASTLARVIAPLLAGLAYQELFFAAPLILTATLGFVVMLLSIFFSLHGSMKSN